MTGETPDTDTLLRELNHRVKNNFQIIVSLMNLRKRMLPPERHEDIRFIEEHVQSMSVAYRLVYATASIVDVPLSELVIEVMSGLRQIAGVSEEQVRVTTPAVSGSLCLDQAIALALYLAVVVPPYLDHAAATSETMSVTVNSAAKAASLTVRGDWNEPITLDFLRERLMHAYAEQLVAEVPPAEGHVEARIRFTLEPG